MVQKMTESHDWKTYSVSIPITNISSETVLKNLEEDYRRCEESMREQLTADAFGISPGEVG